MNEEYDDIFDDKDIVCGIGFMIEAIKQCREDSKRRHALAGTIKCPQCGENLRYTIAKCNSHLWGKCDTENCLSWMQ